MKLYIRIEQLPNKCIRFIITFMEFDMAVLYSVHITTVYQLIVL